MEKYEKAFAAANVAKEQSFYCRQPILLVPRKLDDPVIKFSARLTAPESNRSVRIALTLDAEASFPKLFADAARDAFAPEIDRLLKKLRKEEDEKKALKNFLDSLHAEDIDFQHRHYVSDNEYIPYGEDIATFLQREIAKPIIHWEDSPQLGYEILPNKYFYRYHPPTPAKELLDEFWKLEMEAEKMLKGLAR